MYDHSVGSRRVERSIKQVLIGSGMNTFLDTLPNKINELLTTLFCDENNQRMLIGSAIQEDLIPMLAKLAEHRDWKTANILAEIDRIYNITNKVIKQNIDRIIQELSHSKIAVALLHGSDISRTTYPNEIPLALDGVDLLIRPPDASQVLSIFSNSGFICSDRVNLASLIIERKPEFEIDNLLNLLHHHSLPNIQFIRVPELDPCSEIIKSFQNDGHWKDAFSIIGDEVFYLLRVNVHFNISTEIALEDIWFSPRKLSLIKSIELFGLGESTLAWYLPSRFYHDFMVSGIARIRDLIDIAVVIHSFNSTIDWEYVLEVACRYNVKPALYYTMNHVNEMIGTLVPPGFLKAVIPSSNDFGRLHDWGDFMPRMLDIPGKVYPLFEGMS